VDDILNHPQHEGATATAHTKQDMARNDHKKGDLKHRVDVLEKRFKMVV
jgi:hypothetical protein